MAISDPTMERLEQQIEWYDKRSMSNQRAFKWLKIAEIVAGALVPLSAGLALGPLVTGGLGVLIVVFEGLQQVNQYHHNWIIYRSTCESLKHEKYLYLAKAGPYAGATDRYALLAERIESDFSRARQMDCRPRKSWKRIAAEPRRKIAYVSSQTG